MTSKLQKLLTTPPRDLLLIARAWLLFAYADWVIRRRQYQQWPHWMKINPVEGAAEENDAMVEEGREVVEMAAVARVVRLSEIAGRHHYRCMNCLRRCLVQRRLLFSSLGVRASMEVGVKTGNRFEAHSWLRLNGRIINDSKEFTGCYEPLATAADSPMAALL